MRVLRESLSLYLTLHLDKKRLFCSFPVKYKSFKEIPGPKAYPVIGTVYKYLPVIGDYNTEKLDKNAWYNWRRYGPLVREELFNGVGLLNLYDPQDMEMVLRLDDKTPCRSSHVAMYHYRMSKPQVYNTGGLLSTNGPEWWRLRSTFQKNFTGPQSVKPFVQRTDKVTRNFVTWIGDGNVTEKEDFLYYLNRLFLEVIGVVAFDENFNSFKPEEQVSDSRPSKIIDAAFNSNAGILKLDTGFVWRIFKTPLYRKLANAQSYLEKVSTDILVNRLEYFEGPAKERPHCLLDDFLNQPNVDFKDIVAMMVDILMAAIDTSSFSTSFLLYHIAKNQECQQKLYDEIQTLLPSQDSQISSEVLAKANYARCCIKESLRLNPVAIGFSRILQKDIVLKDYQIPKGTVIVFQNMVSSRLQKNVKNPEQFYPERYLRGSETSEGVHPFVSLPFGFGLRSCIARRLAEQNMSIALINIIRNYVIKWNGADLGIVTHLINKPDKPISLTFVKRLK